MEVETIVLDTDIVIDFAHGKIDLSRYFVHQEKKGVLLIVSTITVFEYFSGKHLLDASILNQSEELFSRFSIQDVTESIAKQAAKMNREESLYGKIQVADLLIGVTCLVLGGKLLTRNRRHFSLIPGLRFA